MTRSRPPIPAASESQLLVDALHRVSDEVRVLRDVLDEIRDELNWIVQNETATSLNLGHSVLNEMALDPTSDDWGERLQVVRTKADAESDESSAAELQEPASPSEQTQAAEPGRLF